MRHVQEHGVSKQEHEFKVVETAEGSVRLKQAILLYGGDGNSAFATVHQVGKNAHGAAVLLPGKPMTQLAVSRLARRLHRRDPGGFVPENLLYRDGATIAWWVPPQSRQVWFRCAADLLGAEERCEVVPHPGLVFAVSASRQWYVWAVKGDARPHPATALCRSPYWNVWDTCQICVGNVDLPGKTDAERIEAWNDAFFRSWFTHPNGSTPHVKYRGGTNQFWRDMLDGRHRTFPQTALVPTGKTLAQVMNERRGRDD
jgi:PRTRC genetic system protein B